MEVSDGASFANCIKVPERLVSDSRALKVLLLSGSFGKLQFLFLSCWS